MSNRLYRINPHAEYVADHRGNAPLLEELAEMGILIPVEWWCLAHGKEPIRWSHTGEYREFCESGTEEDIGGWYEWDCNVQRLTGEGGG